LRHAELVRLAGAAAVVTFIGHATFLIQTAAGNILTDPMYSERAGPLNIAGPRRARQPPVPLDDLPPISVVLLSHNHYDHCDLPTLGKLAQRFDPLVVTPLGNAALVRSAGMRRIEELDWWQDATAPGLSLTLTPAQHFSARGPFDRNRSLWGGFVLTIDTGARVYFAGDTAYAPVFGEVRKRFGPVDLALLPIGAYEPRWFMRNNHMNPEEAVEALRLSGAPRAFGHHWGTFRLTNEGVERPRLDLAAALAKQAIPAERFPALCPGEVRVVA
jgi:L-ascorbate metabolism protein UlaG (beta-lactamase superfamily)